MGREEGQLGQSWDRARALWPHIGSLTRGGNAPGSPDIVLGKEAVSRPPPPQPHQQHVPKIAFPELVGEMGRVVPDLPRRRQAAPRLWSQSCYLALNGGETNLDSKINPKDAMGLETVARQSQRWLRCTQATTAKGLHTGLLKSC